MQNIGIQIVEIKLKSKNFVKLFFDDGRWFKVVKKVYDLLSSLTKFLNGAESIYIPEEEMLLFKLNDDEIYKISAEEVENELFQRYRPN